MSTFNRCIANLDKTKNKDCDLIIEFIDRWRKCVVPSKSQLRQVDNFLKEHYLDDNIIVEFLSLIKANSRKVDDESVVQEIYETYNQHLFKGGLAEFIDKVPVVGTNVSYYTLSRALHTNNKRLRKSDRIKTFLKEMELNKKKTYHNNIDGRIKSGSSVWVTWCYSDSKKPFSFLKLVDFTKKRAELINQLGLIKDYFITEKNYMLTFELNEYLKVYRATICDAGNNDLFKVSNISNHGYTLALDNQKKTIKFSSENYGKPEGVLHADLLDIKNNIEIQVL